MPPDPPKEIAFWRIEPSLIDHVIFGVNCSPPNREAIRSSLKQEGFGHIGLREAKLDPESFEITIHDCEKSSTISDLL
jgi:hypothetical protein